MSEPTRCAKCNEPLNFGEAFELVDGTIHNGVEYCVGCKNRIVIDEKN